MARWVRRDCLDDLPIEGRDLFATHCWGWALEPIARPTSGWYAAIADLLAVMPDGKLAPWQERALIKGGWLSEDGRLLVGKMKHSTRGVVASAGDDPSFTVTAGMHGTKALFVGGRLDRKTGAVESVLGDSAVPVITTKMLDTRALLIHPTDQRTCPIAPPESPSPIITCNDSGNLYKALLLPRGIAPRGVVGDGFLSSRVKEEFEPANTVIAHRGELTALLFHRVSGRTDDNGALKNVRTADQPSPTVKALGHDQHYRQFDAMLSDASVKCLDTRCLARLQGFPDWFELPSVAYVAGKGIGNAVPPPMYQAIVGPLLGRSKQLEVAA
ncbi:MAG: DNA cytosine methyltransferase, partial [Limnothrix sp.]|nr:DNA cytosine methyltransferase [Limnothrix sp.]